MEGKGMKLGREYPCAVRKVPWDSLWHVQYYMRNPDGKIYKTWDRVKQREAIGATKKLVSQQGLAPARFQGLE